MTFEELTPDGGRIMEPGAYDYRFTVTFERELHPIDRTPRNREHSGRIELGEPNIACFVAYRLMEPQLVGLNPEAIRVTPVTFERVKAKV